MFVQEQTRYCVQLLYLLYNDSAKQEGAFCPKHMDLKFSVFIMSAGGGRDRLLSHQTYLPSSERWS